MHTVSTDDAPRPRGHYSQAVVHKGLVFTAAQLPFDPGSNELRAETIEEQAQQALENLRAVLVAAGAQLTDVLKVTVYVSDIGLWGAVNEVYAQFFGDHRPARSVVPTRELHHGVKLEVEAVAVVR
jgi:2-iminobutanoate/2-iminopropanoate deaminase